MQVLFDSGVGAFADGDIAETPHGSDSSPIDRLLVTGLLQDPSVLQIQQYRLVLGVDGGIDILGSVEELPNVFDLRSERIRGSTFSAEGPDAALAAIIVWEISFRATGRWVSGQGFRNTIAEPTTTIKAKNKRE